MLSFGIPLTLGIALTFYIRAIVHESRDRVELIGELERTRHDLATRGAAEGKPVLAPAVATRLMERMRAPGEEALSTREVEVLRLVARGTSNKKIAAKLWVSEATIKTHLLHTFQKLGVTDRTAAVTVALNRGILRLEGRDP